MSTQNRKHGRKKTPVSSHPLFPAIVALWFGALFGLGSLAVRPSLLESLVLSSHLDVILPMTAPPLGLTARILLALAMAVIGIAAGARIARRIARPKPERRQRRRNATATADKAMGPAATVLSEPPFGKAEPSAVQLAVPTGRRRALAVEHGEREDYRLHAAPLPGGAPEIFDVTQIDLAETAAPEITAEPAAPVAEAQPLELSAFAEPEQDIVAQSYRNDITQTEATDCLVLDEPAEMPEHRQIFGQPQQNLSVESESVAPAEAATSEPAAETAQPRTFDATPPPVATTVPDYPAMPASEPQTPLRRFDSPADAAPSAEQPAIASEPALEELAPASHEGLVLPQDSAAQRIISANLAELSPVELIERFALALQQRRSSAAMPTGLAEAAAAFAMPEPAPVQAPFAAPVAPAPFAAPVAEAAPQPAAEPQRPLQSINFAEVAADIAQANPAPSPLSLPAGLRPIDFSDYEDYEDHDDHQGQIPPRSIAMPAATKAAPPADEPPSEQVAAAAFSLPEAESPEAELPAPNAATEAEVEAEPDVLEQGYSSLLDLNRPVPLRQTFVRIEEPEAESAQIEPVVIFPGQDARAGLRFARPAEDAVSADTKPEAEPSEPVPGVTSLRRFDAPPAAAPAASAPAQDPEEAERALRSALATLQRMSGAA